MTDAFISYAREDREFARKLATALESVGWTVWWDRKIPAGAAYDHAIEHELEKAGCILVLWSAASTTSEWVKNEASVAVERGVLLPVVIEEVRLPLEFRRRQAVDLSKWDGDLSEEGFKAVSDAISMLAKRATQNGTRAPTTHPLGLSRRISKILGGSVLAVVAVATILVAIYKPTQMRPSGPTNSNAFSKATFTGEAHWWGKGSEDARSTAFNLELSSNGNDVSGRYVDGTSDSGTVQLKAEGNGLVGDIVSDRAGGRCPLRGTLTSDGTTLEAAYHCADGERGTLSLVRK